MTAPTLPYRVYAICAGSGPVVIGRYESEQERNRAYRMAQQRLRDGGYSPDVRDIALGEDPEWKKERPAMSLAALEVFGGATGTQTVAETNPMPSSVHEHRGNLIQKGLFQ